MVGDLRANCQANRGQPQESLSGLKDFRDLVQQFISQCYSPYGQSCPAFNSSWTSCLRVVDTRGA